MGDWQQLFQSVFIGLVFSYLLAKLISIVVQFKDDKLLLSRNDDFQVSECVITRESDAVDHYDDVNSRASEEDSLVAEKGSVGSSVSGSEEEDDDWEGVETTELDEAFSAATVFVAATVVDKTTSNKVSNDIQLQLYGLYKIATEGPCSSPQPSALKIRARAKWQAWQKLGAMLPEEAMQKYIEIVTELYPTWASSSHGERKGGDSDSPILDVKGSTGPVFSTFIHEEESGKKLEMAAIHEFSREGDIENLHKCINSHISVNLKDSEGRTPLHWAVDRGHFDIVKLLISMHADVNAKDNDGETPLDYAVLCEREAIAGFLVEHKATTSANDNDGDMPV